MEAIEFVIAGLFPVFSHRFVRPANLNNWPQCSTMVCSSEVVNRHATWQKLNVVTRFEDHYAK